MKLAVKTTNGNPIADLPIAGFTDENSVQVKTDKNGIAKGNIFTGNVTFSVSGYTELSDFSKSYKFAAGGSYEDEWTLTTSNFKSFTASGTAKFSANCESIDYTIAGAGGGGGQGGGGRNNSGGGGGG